MLLTYMFQINGRLPHRLFYWSGGGSGDGDIGGTEGDIEGVGGGTEGSFGGVLFFFSVLYMGLTAHNFHHSNHIC